MSKPKIVLHQAVHNRPIYTKIAIHTIGQRTLYPNWTWIVSAIACDQETTNLLHTLRDQYHFTLVDYTANVGQWAACQAAWDTSDAPLLSHIQNDIIVPMGWLSALELAYDTFDVFLVGAYPFGVSHFPLRDIETRDGLGIVYATHIAGTAFLLHRTDWKLQGKISTAHAIFGFGAYQANAAKRGAKIAYPYPPIKIIHMDEAEYPYSLRETTYKAETDRVFILRHNKPRKPNQWP